MFTQRQLTAWVGADCVEAKLGVTVDRVIVDDAIPEQQARFRPKPGRVNDLLPQLPSLDLFGHFWLPVDGPLQCKRLVLLHSVQEVVTEA